MSEETKTLPCVDKMAFDTFKEAEASALAADWQHGAKLRPYQCKHCKLWHMTTSF